MVLQQDTLLDGRFIRGFHEVHFRAAGVGAVGATISYAWWGRRWFAAATAAVARLAMLPPRKVLITMGHLGERIQTQDANAIWAFRPVHSAALLANLTQWVALVWGVTKLSL